MRVPRATAMSAKQGEVDQDDPGVISVEGDGVADAVEAAEQDEGGDAGGDGEENRQRVGQLCGIRKQRVHPAEFDGQPENRDGGVVADSAGWLSGAGGDQE